MSHILFLDGNIQEKMRKATGTGTNADPFVPLTGIDGSLPDTVEGDLAAIRYAIEYLSGTTLNTTCTIYNVAMDSAGVEFSQGLLDGTRKISIKTRLASDISEMGDAMRWSFETGHVDVPGEACAAIPAGSSYSESGLLLNSATLYFASPVDTDVCEIICWG